MRPESWTIVATALVSLGLGRGAALGAEDGEHDFTVVDAEAVYFGSGEHPSSPAVTRADDVWAQIPEYKRIVDENLTDDDAEYHLLMKKASERWQKALKAEAKREDYSLIAEVDAVVSSTGKDIPDVTQDLIDLVTRD
ncbi:MAG: hypothetical protein ACREID_07825 [Planctomycetota bacterium]